MSTFRDITSKKKQEKKHILTVQIMQNILFQLFYIMKPFRISDIIHYPLNFISFRIKVFL